MKLRYVGDAPFFSALSEQEQECVSERMHMEHHRSGEVLFRKGDSGTALYLIKSGWVRLLANGGAALASQGPGSLVGETDVFLDQPRSFGAIAATDVELWALSRDDLVDLIAEDPQIGIKLTLAFGSRLALFDRYLVEQRLKPLAFFAGLGDDSLAAIAQRLLPVKKREGEFVVESGQPPEALFIVETGQLRLHSSEEGGDFSELGPGESFGEMAVLTGKPHANAAQAASEAVLWVLPVAEFDELANDYPQIRLALSKSIREPLLPQDQSHAVERLASIPLFDGLSEDVLWAVADKLLLLHVPAGEVIFAEGTPGDAFYMVDSGIVEILSDGPQGRTVLARLGEDEFFGEMALLTGKPRSTGARVATHSNLWALYRSDFDDLVNRYPSISLALSQVLSERLAQMDHRFSESHLRGLKLLANLSPGQLEDVSRRLRPVRFRQGEVVILEGETGREMYFIESGRVRVERGQGSDRVVLDELEAGDLFGEMALLSGTPRAATVTAVTDVNLWRMSQEDFDDLVTAYPNLALALSRLLSERLRSTDERFLRRTAAEAAPGPQPVPVTMPAARPVPRAKEIPAPAPVRVRPRLATGLTARLAEGFDGAVGWFGDLSTGAKLRLLLVTMLLAWIVLIALPALVISTLAADDVTNLQGAIAFVQTDAPVLTDTPPATDTSTPEPVLVELSVPAEPMALMEAPAQEASGLSVEAAAVPSEAVAGPVAEPMADTPPTATPWIIVVTNTPPPPTDTPLPTDTPVPPTATPQVARVAASAAQPLPTPTSAERPQPERVLDPRLSALNVAIEPVGVRPGQSYWRVIEVRWQDGEEASGDHTIYVEILDEGRNRIVGQPVELGWGTGTLTVMTEDKPANEYPANFPMYNTLGSYSVSVPGLPSDVVVGLGLGTPEEPWRTIHTNFFLTFQRVTR
ncbi:MAG: cyclic nucleotide-binding domain-containing protein [Anaerolineae bacterium]|nr:cyclic nucleotide-binding domain-containing protein [Anaerolineae bacterium]